MIFVRVTIAKVLIALASLLALAGAAIAALSHTAAAQGAASGQSAFLILRGADTLVVERVTQSPTEIRGDIAIRGAGRVTFRAELVQGPAVPFIEFQQYGPGAGVDAPALVSGTIRISGDSAVLEAIVGGATQRFPKAATGWPIPTINNDFALFELFIARAKRSKDAPYSSKMFALTGTGALADVGAAFAGRDSVVLTIAGNSVRLAIDSTGHIAGGALPGGLTLSRVSGAAAAKIALGRTDYGAPAGAPYVAEEVSVPARGGHTLTGTLTLPRGASGSVPAVVTITGSGQQDRDEFLPILPGFRPFRQVADTLGRRGIAVLRLDDRGVNGSGGDVLKATSADFADDIRAGVAYLRTRREIDPDRIALFGHSEGGLIGPMVAATDARLAALVIAAGPAYTGRNIIDFQLRNLVDGNSQIPAAKKDSAAKASVAAFDSTARNNPWLQFFLTHDPIPTLKRVQTPTLILQGGTDQQVTPEQAPLVEKALRDGGNRNVTTKVFANRNHLFLVDSVGFPGAYATLKDSKIGGDVLGPLADWLVVTLKATATRP